MVPSHVFAWSARSVACELLSVAAAGHAENEDDEAGAVARGMCVFAGYTNDSMISRAFRTKEGRTSTRPVSRSTARSPRRAGSTPRRAIFGCRDRHLEPDAVCGGGARSGA